MHSILTGQWVNVLHFLCALGSDLSGHVCPKDTLLCHIAPLHTAAFNPHRAGTCETCWFWTDGQKNEHVMLSLSTPHKNDFSLTRFFLAFSHVAVSHWCLSEHRFDWLRSIKWGDLQHASTFRVISTVYCAIHYNIDSYGLYVIYRAVLMPHYMLDKCTALDFYNSHQFTLLRLSFSIIILHYL